MNSRLLTTICFVTVTLSACTPKKAEPTAASSQPSTSSSSALPPLPTPQATGSDSPATPGRKFTGSYESKPAKLSTPDKVPDVTWKNDDGTSAVGKGTLILNVGDDVRGEATGPLGKQLVSGVLDGNTLRLQLWPEDPSQPLTMTCTGVGEKKSESMSGELRCASAKGIHIRTVSFEVK